MGKGEGSSSFSSRLLGNTFHNVMFIIMVSLWVCMGVTEVVIGALYFDDCSREDMITVWLIVDAFLPIFFIVGGLLQIQEGAENRKIHIPVILIVGAIVSVVWWVLGAVWIYPNRDKDCDDAVGTTAFTMLTIHWSTMWMWINFVGLILWLHFKKPVQCKEASSTEAQRCSGKPYC